MEERIYTISFQKLKAKVPISQRAKRAMHYIREFLSRHLKTDPENIKIGSDVNEKIWERGIEKIPAKIKVKCVKEKVGDKEIWKVSLVK